MISNRLRNLVILTITCILGLTLLACSSGQALRIDGTQAVDTHSAYTLILCGGNYGDDLETVAFLDKEGDRYTLEPYAPDFSFKVRKGLNADRALKEAGEFIRSHADFHSEQVRSIKGEKGEVIGYELRPLYLPVAYGTDDVVDVDYVMKGDKVLIYIKLKPFLDKRKNDVNNDE